MPNGGTTNQIYMDILLKFSFTVPMTFSPTSSICSPPTGKNHTVPSFFLLLLSRPIYCLHFVISSPSLAFHWWLSANRKLHQSHLIHSFFRPWPSLVHPSIKLIFIWVEKRMGQMWEWIQMRTLISFLHTFIWMNASYLPHLPFLIYLSYSSRIQLTY